MRLTSAALVLAAACLLGLSAEAGKLRQRSKAFPIPDINDMEHVVFRKGAGTPCLVTEVVDQQDLNGAPLPAKHRFRVLRFDKGTGKRQIESAVSCGPAAANATDQKAQSDRAALLAQNPVQQCASASYPACQGNIMRGQLLYSYIQTEMAGGLAAAALTAPEGGLQGGTRRFLVVGMGAGMIPMYITEVVPQAAVTALEMDPVVIEATKECFFAGKLPFDAVEAEGRGWVERFEPKGADASAGRFDTVIIDAFTPDDRIPPCLTTSDFLNKLKSKVLRTGGVVVHNTWGSLDPDYARHQATYVANFKNVFVGVSPGLENKIIVAWDGEAVDKLDFVKVSGILRGAGMQDSDLHSLGKWGSAAAFSKVDPKGLPAAALDKQDNIRCGCEGPRCKSMATTKAAAPSTTF